MERVESPRLRGVRPSACLIGWLEEKVQVRE